MAKKLRCPACGAKNAIGVRRCRVCTAILDASVPERAPTAAGDGAGGVHGGPGDTGADAVGVAGPVDLFAGVAEGGGPLGAEQPAEDRFDPQALFAEVPHLARTHAPVPPPEPVEEQFDPDELFRDMDR